MQEESRDGGTDGAETKKLLNEWCALQNGMGAQVSELTGLCVAREADGAW